MIQYIITQSKNQIFENEALDIYFKGTFAVITLNGSNELQNIYIGEGEELEFKDIKLVPENENKALYVEFPSK